MAIRQVNHQNQVAKRTLRARPVPPGTTNLLIITPLIEIGKLDRKMRGAGSGLMF
jgi:hypothetical protein